MSRAGRLSDIFEAIALEYSADQLREIIRREGAVDQIIFGGNGEPEAMTALVVAIRSGNEVAARVLLENGADTQMGCINKTADVTAENLAREFNPDLANRLFTDEVLMTTNQRAKSARVVGVGGASGAGAEYSGGGGGGGAGYPGGGGGAGYSGGGGGRGGRERSYESDGSDDPKSEGGAAGYAECIGYGAKEEDLFNACLNGGVDEVNELLKSGVNIRATDASGMTVLFQATCNQTADAVEIIEALQAAGIDFNAKDRFGRTALMYAVCGEEGDEEFLSSPDVIQALITNGADINARDSSGWTAIMRAVQLGHKSTFSALLERGADLEAKSTDNFTLQDLVIMSEDQSFKEAIEREHSGGAGAGYAGGGGGGGGGISGASAHPVVGAKRKRDK